MITSDIRYIGVNDHEIDLFEGQYPVPRGMSYNSYVILDEATAVMDTVDTRFVEEWLENLQKVLAGRKPEFLIVQHMEPDHSAGIVQLTCRYPEMKVIASRQAFVMMKNYFGTDFDHRQIIVGEGDKISLGKHLLTFLTAPMVHWPEVLVTYDHADKVLFSADGFGKFGALDESEDWTDEARRYYFGIVGKYGMQVQNLLKKVAALDIQKICPLHGPVLTEGIADYLTQYQIWSKYEPEEEGTLIAYTSVYGNTQKAVMLFAEKLREKGEKVVVYDLARCDMTRAVAEAFRYSKLVLATTTYNGEIFPFMREFINHLTERGFCNRKIGLIENGSWAPLAAKVMKGMFEKSKGLEISETVVKIMSALNDSARVQLEVLADELAGQVRK